MKERAVVGQNILTWARNIGDIGDYAGEWAHLRACRRRRYAEVVWELWDYEVYTLTSVRRSMLVGKYGCTVRRVLRNLRALQPAVLAREQGVEVFRRRHYCQPVVFLCAVESLYSAQRTPLGVRMFLTPERVEWLCRLCVLDPLGLDNVLAMTKRVSDYERGGLFDYGWRGGFGRWILLAPVRGGG